MTDRLLIGKGVIEKLGLLLKRPGLLVRLRGLEFQESHLENMVTETLESTQIRTNPWQPTRKDAEDVYRTII